MSKVDDCERCGRVAEAFEAMREALKFVSGLKLDNVTAHQVESALVLADEVSK